MRRSSAWWPLSEVAESERDRILSLPAAQREKVINQLKADLKSGAHARRLLYRTIDERNGVADGVG